MDSLRALSSPSAAVLRDGHVSTVPSEVVPGDIVEIKTGDTVPADLRIFDAMNLECDEKILTGGAIPVAKDVASTFVGRDEVNVGVGDRLNTVYSSQPSLKVEALALSCLQACSLRLERLRSLCKAKAGSPIDLCRGKRETFNLRKAPRSEYGTQSVLSSDLLPGPLATQIEQACL